MCNDVLNKRNIGDWMKIIFTGGGTAGHISLNLALIPHFIELGYEVHYIGSKNGMEKEIIKELKNVKYHEISTGKLRRYFSIENFKDPFRVINGVIESKRIIKKIKPNIVFSKGGFVSLPVVIGAKLNNVPVVAHESDLSAGLANKLASPFCKKIFLTFEDKNNKFKEKGEYVGALVREEIKTGNKEKGKKDDRLFIKEMKNYSVALVEDVKCANSKFTHDNLTGKKCPECGKYMLEVKGKNGLMYVCQDRECGHRENISRLTNARCPECKKRLEIRGQGDGKIYVCPGANCNFREKASVFEKRFDKKGKMDKRQVNNYMKKLQKEAEQEAMNDNPFAALLKDFGK